MSALHVTQLGDSGPPVAFLHGLFGQGKNWTTLAKQLSGDRQVILIDMPNHGRSAWTAGVSYPDMAEAVAEVLADHGPTAVVGHSMGGKIAMALALQRPELVERLCVVDISPVDYQGLTSFGKYVHGMRALDLDQLTDRTAADVGLQPYVEDATVRGFLLQNLRRDGQSWRWQMNLQVLGDQLDVLAGWPQIAADPYQGKVLWLAGQNSHYIQPEYADPMHALFPRARLVTIKKAGHWVHSEQPEAFLATLRMFLQA